MLGTYVYLMRIRYSNGFEVSYDIQRSCMDYLPPRLTLQPVVENSITHGFGEMDEELGRIQISVYQTEGFLCLAVWDNGRGMSIRTMIVDDEALIHATLHSMIDWESRGYTVVCDCSSGRQALEWDGGRVGKRAQKRAIATNCYSPFRCRYL